jgi:DNA-binding PadR family transcriptional regulator
MVKASLTIEHALLGFLQVGSMHAYEMHRHLQRAGSLGLVWRIKQSQLYALLARLESAGYLTTTTAPQEPRPARKMLHLTPAGRRAFQLWRTTPVAHGRELRQEFLAKLYFAQQESPTTASGLIEAQREVCRTMLARLQERAGQAPNSYARLVFAFRRSQLTASLAWLDECAATLVEFDSGSPAPRSV